MSRAPHSTELVLSFQTDPDSVQAAFLRRAMSALERITATAPSKALTAALAAFPRLAAFAAGRLVLEDARIFEDLHAASMRPGRAYAPGSKRDGSPAAACSARGRGAEGGEAPSGASLPPGI